MRALAIVLTSFTLIQFASAGDDWLSERFSRPLPDHLDWSADSKKAEAFMPSGIGYRILRCGDFTVLHNHGIYHSNEENPDTSHDQRASVIVFRGEQRAFVARGYKFSDFRYDAATASIKFQYWKGVMGSGQIEEVTLSLGRDGIECATHPASTKDKR
jgi:hypothetical protein